MDDDQRLQRMGYEWKIVKVRCCATSTCGWEGKRVWREKMFDKPCPRCKHVCNGGSTTLFSPPHIEKIEENK